MIRTNDGTQTKRLAGVGDKIPVLGVSPQVITYTASGGETSINLAAQTPSISYKPGQHQLKVKRSSGGGELFAGIDYTETSPTTIGFAAGDALIAGEIVEVSLNFMATGVMAVEPRPDCYTAVATAGQTLVTADFSWTYNAFASKGVGAVRVYLHGVLQTRGVDYTEVNLGTAMTNQVLFVDALLGGENIVILPTQQVIDDAGASTQFNNSRVTGLQNLLSAGAQNFVDQSTDTIAVPNTSIVGRAKIPNLANDLRASLGVERIPVQSIVQLQDEFGAQSNGGLYNGPADQPVFSVLNNDRGLIRIVGSSAAPYINANGPHIYLGPGEYIEVVFYGTGLNGLFLYDQYPRDYRVTIDGMAESGNLYSGASSGSVILNGRGYNPNAVIPVASGLTLGVHTAKIRGASGTYGFYIFGFEILNSNASGLVNVNPGTAYVGGLKVVKPSASSVAYNTGVTGTRGGRIVRYLNSDGTVGQAFTAVDAAPAYLSSANHANEEVVRTYHWREFGCGRLGTFSDDFSLLAGTVSSRAFTLDDGTTTLVGKNVANGLVIPQEGLSYNNTSGNFITITFIGSGLDVVLQTDASTRQFDAVSVDGGTSLGALAVTGVSPSSPKKTYRVASGLAYGTHTVKFYQTSNTYSPGLFQFIVYQPKKPTIPATALELCDYNVMADYAVGNAATAEPENIVTGSLVKTNARECVYVGAWSDDGIGLSNLGGLQLRTTSAGAYVEYTFFGTGIVMSGLSGATIGNISLQIDGSAYATATVIRGYTNSGSGNYAGPAINTNGRLLVSGLSLGVHKIRVTHVSGTFLFDSLYIITPIHSYKSNLYADLQNTLPVGSQSLMDSRKTSMIKEALPAQKAWAQAIGIAAGPTTNSVSGVPIPDMSVTIKTNGGPIQISYSVCGHTASTGSPIYIAPYVDGVISQGAIWMVISGDHSTAATASGISNTFVTPLSAGVHKVDLYWSTDSSIIATAVGVRRTLTVQEL